MRTLRFFHPLYRKRALVFSGFALALLTTWLLADTTVPNNTNVTSGQTLNVRDPGKVSTTGSVQVQPGGTALFSAGTGLDLTPGFHAFSGSGFHAVVDLNPGNLADLTDSDSDGLPDAWEMLYFGHLGVDRNADADGDGISNLAEYRAGTNPLVNENTAPPPANVQVVVRTPNGQYQGVKTDWSIVSVP